MHLVDFGYSKELFNNEILYDHYDDFEISWQSPGDTTISDNQPSGFIKVFCNHNGPKLKWCRENCKSQWGFKVSDKWYFSSNFDRINFILRWM